MNLPIQPYSIKNLTWRHHRALFLVAMLLVLWLTIPARADWRTDLGTFRIGMVSGIDPRADVARVEPFRLAIAEAIGMDVEIVPFRNFPTLVSAQAAGRVEYSILSSAAFSTGWVSCECLEPLASVSDDDGSNTISAIVVARDNGPSTIAGLEGKPVIAIDGRSLGVFDFAKFQMAKQGTNLDMIAGDLKKTTIANSALDEFERGAFDAIVGWSSLSGDHSQGYSKGTLQLLASRNTDSIRGYKLIWKSDPVPLTTHVVRKNMNAEAKTILHKVLENMFETDPVAYDSIEPVHGGGFVTIKQSDFAPFIEFIRSLDNRKTPSPSSSKPNSRAMEHTSSTIR